MSDFLTRAEYAAIAKEMDLPSAAFIDGKYRAGKGKKLTSYNPATAEVLCEIAACNDKDVGFAVSKARQAFERGDWATLHPSKRKDAMIRLAKLMNRQRRALAVMESLDSGKPIRDCESLDIPESIATIRWHAELIDKIYDSLAPSGDAAMAMVLREPVGVVGLVLPWNFPLLMLAWKIAPALAAGNSVIVKPAEQTSLTALKIAELAAEAGIPSGVLQVLPGDGESVGEPLGRHADVDMISFTGSTETGKRFLHYAGDSNLKNVVLECGGKNAALVLEDAEDLDAVAEHITRNAFWNMGENCSATSRLIVHKNVKDKLLKLILKRTEEWHAGDPLEPKNRLGALIDSEHCQKVKSYLQCDKQAKLLSGGKIKGAYATATVFDAVKPDSKLAKEEIFGPVLSVQTVNSTDEAIMLANSSVYGLTACVFSGNLKRALNTAKALRCGTVAVNCCGEGDISTPFGGYKQSGFGGRDNGIQAHDQYTEFKTIWLDLDDAADGDLIE